MPIPPCQDDTHRYSGGVSAQAPIAQRQFTLSPLGGSNPLQQLAPVFIGTDSPAGVLQAGFESDLWIVSNAGVNPQFEVLLASMVGALPPGSVVQSTWNTTSILPTAGRLFDWTRDAVVATINDAFNPPTAAAPLVLSWLACTGIETFDCCSEVLAKLDSLLAAVTKVYHNVP